MTSERLSDIGAVPAFEVPEVDVDAILAEDDPVAPSELVDVPSAAEVAPFRATRAVADTAPDTAPSEALRRRRPAPAAEPLSPVVPDSRPEPGSSYRGWTIAVFGGLFALLLAAIIGIVYLANNAPLPFSSSGLSLAPADSAVQPSELTGQSASARSASLLT